MVAFQEGGRFLRISAPKLFISLIKILVSSVPMRYPLLLLHTSASHPDFCSSNKSFLRCDGLTPVFACCFFLPPGFQFFMTLLLWLKSLVFSFGPCSSADGRNPREAQCLYCSGGHIRVFAVLSQLVTHVQNLRDVSIDPVLFL